MRRSTAVWVALLAVPMAQGIAQGSAGDTALVLEPGLRVRIVAPSIMKERISGTIRAVRADHVVIDTVDARLEHRLFFPSTIVVDEYRSMSLPMSAVASIEESRGHSRLLGMVKGAAKGALFVGIFGGLTALSGQKHATFRDFTSGFAAGAATGAAIGGPIGFHMGVERWRSVRIKTRRSPPPSLASTEKK